MEQKNDLEIVFRAVVLSVLVTLLVIVGVLWWVMQSGTLSLLLTDESENTESVLVEEPAVKDVPTVVEAALPAVVSIVITAEVPIIEQYYEEFFNPFDVFGGFGWQVPRQRQIGTERQEIGGGTGFFVSADGFIVTNRHVVDTDGADYSVVTNDGESFQAEVIARDPSLDIAILKVESEELFTHLEFGTLAEVALGETAIAIGNALAEFPNSVSVGVISGLSRNIMASDGFSMAETLEGVIQTDAAINRGNSGGPLLNMDGEVIGVNVAVAGDGENIGFALPADVVAAVYRSVQETGQIIRPYIGIRYIPVTSDLVAAEDLSVEYGVLVQGGASTEAMAVLPDSPAEKAGLLENDVVLSINSVELNANTSLGSALRAFSVGETVALEILRAGERQTISLTLEALPDTLR